VGIRTRAPVAHEVELSSDTNMSGSAAQNG
ncbi:MAG: hypothetical protein JWM03_1584, partial [Rhodocyclales bacterium]|nr:hypothetical protein [Rhodocyclales bacterium]